MNSNVLKASVCMGSISKKVQYLMKSYPPEFKSERKASFYESASSIHRRQNGIIKFSRWRFAQERNAPLILKNKPVEVEGKNSFYDYSDKDTETSRVWYMNFSSPILFGDYEGDSFGQSQIQVLEHPLLGSVYKYLEKNKIPGFEPGTTMYSKPTPFLIENVPYWIRVNTNPVVSIDGKHYDFYGWKFAETSKSILSMGIRQIQHEESNNIIAMSAPSCGRGNEEKMKNQIEMIIKTLLVGFGAAVKTTTISRKKDCIIHTGNWGCGTMGNDRELTYLLQILCAGFTGVKKIVFHGLSQEDEKILKSAREKSLSIPNGIKLADYIIEQGLCGQQES